MFRGASSFGQGSGPIFLQSFVCDGSEENLLRCVQGVIGYHECAHSQDAGVRCVGTLWRYIFQWQLLTFVSWVQITMSVWITTVAVIKLVAT